MKTKIFTLLSVIFLVLLSQQAGAITVSPAVMPNVTITQAQSHHFSPVLQPIPEKSQTIAFALALVGVIVLPIGLHRYYLGYKKQGIIMTVLTLTGIGAIVSWVWSIIDLIHILTGELKPADGSDYTDLL